MTIESVWNNRRVNPAPSAHEWYLLACVAGTVLMLLVLVMRFRLHAAMGLAVVAFALGIASGMPLKQVPLSFSAGVGNMMGHIAIILAMGAILGQLLASSGAGAALGKTLVEGFGPKGVPWALLALGILVGLPVFFEVGLVLLMPIIVDTARRSGKPPALVGLPVLAGLSIMHGMVPPHPGAMLAATVYHADVGRTILWGLVVGIPAAALAGPVLERVLTRQWRRHQGHSVIEGFAPPAVGGAELQSSQTAAGARAPAGAVQAVVAILLPVALIFVGSWADTIASPGSRTNQALHLAGYPDAAMLIGALVALAMLGPHVQDEAYRVRGGLRRLMADSFGPIASVLVILSAAGGLSGVLRDSGAAQATVGLALGAHMPPLVLAWVLAAVVRVTMGSATVATAVSSGVLAPLAGHMGVNPEMLVLATGSGSLFFSHVNDSGFWLIQSLFKLEVKGVFATWSMVETVVSISGLGCTLLLAALVR